MLNGVENGKYIILYLNNSKAILHKKTKISIAFSECKSAKKLSFAMHFLNLFVSFNLNSNSSSCSQTKQANKFQFEKTRFKS